MLNEVRLVEGKAGQGSIGDKKNASHMEGCSLNDRYLVDVSMDEEATELRLIRRAVAIGKEHVWAVSG
jgi:hypothetical protein